MAIALIKVNGNTGTVVSKHKTYSEADAAHGKLPFHQQADYIVGETKGRKGSTIALLVVQPLYMTALGL